MAPRQDSYHRSFVAMRNALRSILIYGGECSRYDDPDREGPCDCPHCIAKAALEGEEDWRFMGYSPERRQTMPRELAITEAWKHYFKQSAGNSTGGSGPMDQILAKIINVDTDSITERDWYVATSVVQWLATNVGQCVLFDAGYVHAPPPAQSEASREKEKEPRP